MKAGLFFICFKYKYYIIQDDVSYPYLYRISYAWYSLIFFVVALGLGLIASEIARLIWSKLRDEQPHRDFFMGFVRDRMPDMAEKELNMDNVMEEASKEMMALKKAVEA